LELTESSVMRDDDQSIQAMHRLANLGVGIAIDDFGTGYSTLSYIKDLPVDTLKVDRAFISELTTGGKHSHLVRAIVELGNSLSLAVVAEGIESPEQEQELRDLGCRYGQGFHYWVPMLPSDVDVLLIARDELPAA